MGVDLILIPQEFGGNNVFLGNTRLKMNADSELFDRIRELPSYPLDPVDGRLSWHTEDGYLDVTADSYDTPLRWVLACVFYRLDADEDPKICEWNKAVMAFVYALPPKTRILLFWD